MVQNHTSPILKISNHVGRSWSAGLPLVFVEFHWNTATGAHVCIVHGFSPVTAAGLSGYDQPTVFVIGQESLPIPGLKKPRRFGFHPCCTSISRWRGPCSAHHPQSGAQLVSPPISRASSKSSPRAGLTSRGQGSTILPGGGRTRSRRQAAPPTTTCERSKRWWGKGVRLLCFAVNFTGLPTGHRVKPSRIKSRWRNRREQAWHPSLARLYYSIDGNRGRKVLRPEGPWVLV